MKNSFRGEEYGAGGGVPIGVTCTGTRVVDDSGLLLSKWGPRRMIWIIRGGLGVSFFRFLS